MPPILRPGLRTVIVSSRAQRRTFGFRTSPCTDADRSRASRRCAAGDAGASSCRRSASTFSRPSGPTFSARSGMRDSSRSPSMPPSMMTCATWMPCGPNSRAIDWTSRRRPPLVALKAAKRGRPRSEPEAPVKITVPRPSGARRRIASRPNRKPAKQPTRQESSKCCAVISRKSTAALLPMLKTKQIGRRAVGVVGHRLVEQLDDLVFLGAVDDDGRRRAALLADRRRRPCRSWRRCGRPPARDSPLSQSGDWRRRRCRVPHPRPAPLLSASSPCRIPRKTVVSRNLRCEAAASLRSARMKLPPYPMIEPDLGAPLDVHRATVLPEWIDWNGHMNVGFYVVAFDKATDTLCAAVRLQLGIHARQDRHDLRARGARHLRPRGQGRRSAAHHHADPRPRRQARALHPRDVPRDRRLSRRHQRADADEHRLCHPPLRAVARLGDGRASRSSPPPTSACPCRSRPAASSASRRSK